MNTHEKENRATSNTHTQTQLRHSQVINGRCPLCLKSYCRDSGSPNTRNSSRGCPAKSNILFHSSREKEGGRLMTEGRETAPNGYENHLGTFYYSLLSNPCRITPLRLRTFHKRLYREDEADTQQMVKSQNKA